VDLSADGARVWRNAAAATADLESAFEAEGQRGLWESRSAEATAQLALVEAGRRRRWLVTSAL